MERPFAVIRCRAHVRRAFHQYRFNLFTRFRLLFAPLFVFALFCFSASPAQAAPTIWLPTPVGERWKVIQGYNCGTHNSWDHYALDLVSAEGKTYGAPVRAAADGEVFVWESKSGTLIVRHGDSFYTQYTHMASKAVEVGSAVKRGDIVGTVGDRGTRGNPHLHFHAFTASGAWASNRQTVPLSFAEGYDFPETGGCSQHQGATIVAGNAAGAAMAGLSFQSEAQPNRWYNQDAVVVFAGTNIARGFSMAWDNDPGGDTPTLSADAARQSQISAVGEGLHTLYVRGWDGNGQSTLSTFGPIGFDTTAPSLAESGELQTVPANTAGAIVRWSPASDAASGVAGYRVYIGADGSGTSEWYVATVEVAAPTLAPGSYTLRVQPVDYAGNTGAWVTVGQVIAQ